MKKDLALQERNFIHIEYNIEYNVQYMYIIPELYTDIIAKNSDTWVKERKSNVQPVFYSSIDIRNAGYKIAPVDFNFFPAGFSNININSQALREVKNFITNQYPDTKKILLTCEKYTKHLKYLGNIYALIKLLTNAGYEAECCTIEQSQNEILKLKNNQTITINALTKKNGLISTKNGFIPNLIIMNSDTIRGIPAILKNIKQPITPSAELGWFQRRKSNFFNMYYLTLQDFCKTNKLDSWLLSTIFHECENFDFDDQHGIENIANTTEKIITQIKEKYRQYNIKDTPYVFIKPNNGTYGMGIMNAKSGDEVMSMTKEIYNKMRKIKARTKVKSLIIQEGILTIDKVNNSPAEIVIYLINANLINILYRSNDRRDEFVSLNSLSASLQEAKNLTTKYKAIVKLISEIAILAAAKEAQIYLK